MIPIVPATVQALITRVVRRRPAVAPSARTARTPGDRPERDRARLAARPLSAAALLLTLALATGAAGAGAHTITATAGSGGSINPSGAVTVDDGASQSFAITPDPGYQVADVLVDGSSAGAVGTYDFTGVTGDHTIDASFAPVTQIATIDAGSPPGVLSPATPTLSIPVSITRNYTTSTRLFHVVFQLGGGLALTGGTAGVTEGTFLSGAGATTTFQVLDKGSGSYSVDGAILGLPCNATALGGSLFNVAVSSAAPSGPGTLTITSVVLRDCGNLTLPSAIGTSASVAIDNTPPAITVSAPALNAAWTAGSVQDIAWTATDDAGLPATPIAIDGSVDGGLTWSPIASGLANSGTYAWTVPATLTSNAVVRVSATDVNGNTASQSSAAFTINTTTSVAVGSNHAPSTFGQPVTFTATLTPGSASGDVTFKVDHVAVETVALAGGVATSTPIAGLAVGPHDVEADYAGDATHLASSGTLAGGQDVQKATPTVAVTSDTNPSAFGQTVTFTATLAPATATGLVTFRVDGVATGPAVTLAGGIASSGAIATLAVGAHAITADYGGDASYLGASGAMADSQVVTAAASATALAVDLNPSAYGDLVTFTATVTPVAPATAIPTGSVQFLVGATPIGSGIVSGAGVVMLSIATFAVGSRPVTAHYLGDASYAPSTSSAVTQVVDARIVATAGAHGAIAPPGTTTWAPGATPLFTLTPDPGYHVADLLLDGLSVGHPASYTFAPLAASHTLAASFAVNPPVLPIVALAAAPSVTGNDLSGTTNVVVSWPARNPGDIVEVWRAPYGNYPEYDDAPNAGSPPAIPSYPPPAPWQLTAVTTSGASDHAGARDVWYYVAFVTDVYGTRSSVSNLTGGVLNYHLGDVTNGTTPGTGDNQVTIADVSLLGAHYGLAGSALLPWAYLDVGPTTDATVNGRPLTDEQLDFEDLMMFAINYEQVSAPQGTTHPALVAATSDQLELDVPGAFTGGRITVRLHLNGTGAIQGFSARLKWNAAAVTPESFAPGALLDDQGAIALSGRPGVVDIARLGHGLGLVGSGDAAAVTFRRVGEGDPGIELESVTARGGPNQAVALAFSSRSVPVVPAVTSFDRVAPNPVRDRALLSFGLARGGRVDLALFAVDGRRVRTLVSGAREAGAYNVEWDGRDDAGRTVSAGVYFGRLVTAQGSFTRSLAYVK